MEEIEEERSLAERAILGDEVLAVTAVTDQVLAGIEADSVVDEMEIVNALKCMQQFAAVVESHAKFLFAQPATSLCTAAIVLRTKDTTTREMLEEDEAILAHEIFDRALKKSDHTQMTLEKAPRTTKLSSTS